MCSFGEAWMSTQRRIYCLRQISAPPVEMGSFWVSCWGCWKCLGRLWMVLMVPKDTSGPPPASMRAWDDEAGLARSTAGCLPALVRISVPRIGVPAARKIVSALSRVLLGCSILYV